MTEAAHCEPLLLIPLGYQSATPQPRDRKALGEIVPWERWEGR